MQVACGAYHSLALKSDGTIVSWGNDGDGQVSNTPSGNDFFSFIRIYILNPENLLFDPLYPFKNKDTNINISGTINTDSGDPVDVQYRVLLNGEHIYPEKPYPDIIENPPEKATPDMTSNTEPEGVAFASSESAGAEAFKAFDGLNNLDSWVTVENEMPCYLGYEFMSLTKITEYNIVSRDHSSASTRTPKDWSFEGWDGNGWVTLDVRSNETGWGLNESRKYMISNPGEYTKYRINVLSNNGDPYTAIGELEMLVSNNIGYTNLQTTPFNLNIDLDPTLFNIGDNNLIIEVNSPENLQSNELLNTTITKEDRDTFTMNRNLNYNGSPVLNGDAVIDNNKGLTLSQTGKGSAVIKIPTDGKARIISNIFDTSLIEEETKTKTEDMVDQGSLDTGTVYRKEINTDLDITDLNINIKST